MSVDYSGAVAVTPFFKNVTVQIPLNSDEGSEFVATGISTTANTHVFLTARRSPDGQFPQVSWVDETLNTKVGIRVYVKLATSVTSQTPVVVAVWQRGG